MSEATVLSGAVVHNTKHGRIFATYALVEVVRLTGTVAEPCDPFSQGRT